MGIWPSTMRNHSTRFGNKLTKSCSPLLHIHATGCKHLQNIVAICSLFGRALLQQLWQDRDHSWGQQGTFSAAKVCFSSWIPNALFGMPTSTENTETTKASWPLQFPSFSHWKLPKSLCHQATIVPKILDLLIGIAALTGAVRISTYHLKGALTNGCR